MAETAKGQALLMPEITLVSRLLSGNEAKAATELETQSAWLKLLAKKLHQLSNQDAALSRTMSSERWECCMEIDKENRPRSLKAHEDVLRQFFYLKNASYYGSDLLLRALP